jgi:hypothetical protein
VRRAGVALLCLAGLAAACGVTASLYLCVAGCLLLV